MPPPAEGIRVIAWTIWQQGPVASVMLGDLGADVIKVEERVGGDPGRGILKAQGLDLRDRPNFYFEANNRNKRSLTVDLKHPAGVAIVQRLAERADVFVQNFRKGVAGRLGLDAATLRARNPRLVYASASGYGPEGPESGALPRQPRRFATNPLWNHYRCGDDRWLALSMLQPDRYWEPFCAVLEIPEAAADPRFKTMLDRMMNAGECIALLDEVFARRPRAEWLRRLASGGDFIYSILNSLRDLPDDPQMQANGYVTAFEHPAFGPTQVVGLPVRLSETPGSIRLPAPEFGQHTEETL